MSRMGARGPVGEGFTRARVRLEMAAMALSTEDGTCMVTAEDKYKSVGNKLCPGMLDTHAVALIVMHRRSNIPSFNGVGTPCEALI